LECRGTKDGFLWKQLIVGKLFGSGFRNRNKSLRIQVQHFFGEKQYFDNLFAKMIEFFRDSLGRIGSFSIPDLQHWKDIYKTGNLQIREDNLRLIT
jgi:hypothetical protein